MSSKRETIRLVARKKHQAVLESMVAAQEGITGWSQKVLREGRVLFLGAGAIGNESIKNMALTGLGYAMICDMDVVERSNLSRAILLRDAPLGSLKAVEATRRFVELNVEETARADSFVGNANTQLGMGVFRHVDVVVGCLDNLQTRFEANRRCAMLGVPYIDGGISELMGNVTLVHADREAPCWACMFPKKLVDEETEMRRNPCAKAIEDNWATGHAPTTQVTSALISALISQEIVKCLHAQKGNTMSCEFGRSYAFDGWHNSFESINLHHRANCAFHRPFARVEETEITSEWTLGQTLEYVRDHYGPGYVLDMTPDNTFRPAGYVTTARCQCCGKPIKVNCAINRIRPEMLFCPDCSYDEQTSAELWDGTYREFELNEEMAPLMSLSLDALGVPPFHILDFYHRDDENNRIALEMTGDMARVMPHLMG